MILHVLFEISSDVLHKIFVHFIQSRINDPNTFNKQQQKRKGALTKLHNSYTAMASG